MSYVRDRHEERTGFQEHAGYSPLIDFQTDYVMVYGLDRTTADRIRDFRREGYVVHLMTGCAWGEYQDYLYGSWDGKNHWDDAQMDEHGRHVLHGKDVPYMVPTMDFVHYLEEKLRSAVDEGVAAIHVEEPEFWARSGYSPSFRREYKEYYGEDWSDPRFSLDAAWRQARLKAWLYQRLIRHVAQGLKAYARSRGQDNLRFYVPTHSLINYSQWGIVSPEGLLAEIGETDGIIAQVWTGTSREPQFYQGLYKERTFENAFLEYSVMKSLRFHEHQDIWFLQDPIEDNPAYTWSDYEPDYKKTLTAALLHPDVSRYEVCPWPWRVFTGIYPRALPGSTLTHPTEPRAIPEHYASLLSGMFNLLGDMNLENYTWKSGHFGIAVFISDTSLYQRGMPAALSQDVQKLISRGQAPRLLDPAELKAIRSDRSVLDVLRQTNALTDFFGLAMPLLKKSIAVEILQLERLLLDAAYLDRYKVLVLSYDFMKPKDPWMNEVLATWVKNGGTLLYIGDEKDPWTSVRSWWNEEDPEGTPLRHLMKVLSLNPDAADGSYAVDRGQIRLWRISPTMIGLDKEISEAYVQLAASLMNLNSWSAPDAALLHLERGIYDIMALMDESGDKSVTVEGPFVDLFDPRWPVIDRKVLEPGSQAVLVNLGRTGKENRILATSARVNSLSEQGGSLDISLRTADKIRSVTRLQCRRLWAETAGREIQVEGEPVQLQNCRVKVHRDGCPGHILIEYESDGTELKIRLS